jgi:type IV pilus assembly protein PilV
VLVTILILGTSLLAIAALQTRSLQQHHSSYVRTQANILAYDLMDQIRIASPKPPGTLVVPAAATVSATILAALPNGSGTLDCAARLCTATITWDESVGTNVNGTRSTFIFIASL